MVVYRELLTQLVPIEPMIEHIPIYKFYELDHPYNITGKHIHCYFHNTLLHLSVDQYFYRALGVQWENLSF